MKVKTTTLLNRLMNLVFKNDFIEVLDKSEQTYLESRDDSSFLYNVYECVKDHAYDEKHLQSYCDSYIQSKKETKEDCWISYAYTILAWLQSRNDEQIESTRSIALAVSYSAANINPFALFLIGKACLEEYGMSDIEMLDNGIDFLKRSASEGCWCAMIYLGKVSGYDWYRFAYQAGSAEGGLLLCDSFASYDERMLVLYDLSLRGYESAFLIWLKNWSFHRTRRSDSSNVYRTIDIFKNHPEWFGENIKDCMIPTDYEIVKKEISNVLFIQN